MQYKIWSELTNKELTRKYFYPEDEIIKAPQEGIYFIHTIYCQLFEKIKRTFYFPTHSKREH